jgi:putative copper resistance protein D
MLDTVVNFFHLLATAIWIGGAVFMHLVLQPSLKLIDPQQGGKLYGVVAKRFSITGWISLGVLVITGYIKTPERMLYDFSYSLGQFLAVKHTIVILIIIVGLAIAFNVLPNLRKHSPKPGEAPSAEFLRYQKRLGTLAKVNLVLGLLVLALASMLW